MTDTPPLPATGDGERRFANDSLCPLYTQSRLEAIVSAAVQEEREACAQVALSFLEHDCGTVNVDIASAIRFRSTVPTRGETPNDHL